MALVKDFCGRGLNAARPNPSGTDQQYYEGYLYLQTDTAGAEVPGFYRYNGAGTWELLVATTSASAEAIMDIVGALLADGDVDFTYDDAGNTETNIVRKASENFALPGDISPAQITSNQNDYNPTGLSTASTLRLNTDASRNITGLQGGADGRIIVIHNVGSFAIVLKDDDGATSTAGNRFALNSDVTLSTDECAALQYDSTSSRWRMIGGTRPTGLAPTGSAGGDLAGTYPNPTVKTNLKVTTLLFVIDGGGATITTGVKGDLGPFDFAGTIQQVTLLADQSGSIVVDIWKDSYANYPPVVGDSITASAKPTISTATKSQDSTLTGWTTSIAAGDTLRFNVDSITTCQRVVLALKVALT